MKTEQWKFEYSQEINPRKLKSTRAKFETIHSQYHSQNNNEQYNA